MTFSTKDAALTTLDACRHEYTQRGRRALLKALLTTGTATADVIRDAVELPPGTNPKLFGAVPGPLAKAGIIRQSGFAKTSRPEAHGRPVIVWALANRAAAERWLLENPAKDMPHDRCRQTSLLEQAELETLV